MSAGMHRLRGRAFCLTGKMWTDRYAVTMLVRSHGGAVIERINSPSQVLVCGRDRFAVKWRRAEELGAYIISAWELRMVVEDDVTLDEVLFRQPPRKLETKSVTREPLNLSSHRQAVERFENELASFNDREGTYNGK